LPGAMSTITFIPGYMPGLLIKGLS